MTKTKDMTLKNKKISAKDKQPLFHIVKREGVSIFKGILIRAITIISALVFCGILLMLLSGKNPVKVYDALFKGVFGTKNRIWWFLQDTAILLIVALGIVPAFKMKFWNLGGNGQILIGCLATTACMFYLGGKLPDGAVIALMVVSGIVAGAIWAIIPAIFKAFFNTNESLFTLMMNYIAAGLVSYFITIWVKTGSGTLAPIKFARIPMLFNQKAILPIIVALLLTLLSFCYFRYSKHGYEISVVGESMRTAQYIGTNVKKVVIRTLALSGGICGLTGVLLSGAINYTVNADMANNLGFTAIMAAWLGKFNPFVIILTSSFIIFLTRGMKQVNTVCGFSNESLSNIIIAIMYFFIIGCEFFINYKIVFRKKNKISANADNLAKETIETSDMPKSACESVENKVVVCENNDNADELKISDAACSNGDEILNADQNSINYAETSDILSKEAKQKAIKALAELSDKLDKILSHLEKHCKNLKKNGKQNDIKEDKE